MTRTLLVFSAVLALVIGFSAYAGHHEVKEHTEHTGHGEHHKMAEASHEEEHVCTCEGGVKVSAVALMIPTEGNTVHGVVRFWQKEDKVVIDADITGLEPNSTHAIHVHEFGDLTAPDGTAAGGHYNPAGHDHGLPETDARHAGDLGNLTADEAGNANLEITVDNITIKGEHNPVLGRAVIIHAKHDDGGQPTGNAGARIAMGVIGIAKSE